MRHQPRGSGNRHSSREQAGSQPLPAPPPSSACAARLQRQSPAPQTRRWGSGLQGGAGRQAGRQVGGWVGGWVREQTPERQYRQVQALRSRPGLLPPSMLPRCPPCLHPCQLTHKAAGPAPDGQRSLNHGAASGRLEQAHRVLRGRAGQGWVGGGVAPKCSAQLESAEAAAPAPQCRLARCQSPWRRPHSSQPGGQHRRSAAPRTQ